MSWICNCSILFKEISGAREVQWLFQRELFCCGRVLLVCPLPAKRLEQEPPQQNVHTNTKLLRDSSVQIANKLQQTHLQLVIPLLRRRFAICGQLRKIMHSNKQKKRFKIIIL